MHPKVVPLDGLGSVFALRWCLPCWSVPFFWSAEWLACNLWPILCQHCRRETPNRSHWHSDCGRKWHAAYRSCDLRMDLCIDSRFSSACSKSTWFMPSISGPLPLLFAALSRQEGPQVSEEFAGGICHNSDKAVHHTDVTQMACSIDHLHAIQPGFRHYLQSLKWFPCG